MVQLTITNAAEIFGGEFNLVQAIAFTFFIGSMAMMAATAFFWLEMRNVAPIGLLKMLQQQMQIFLLPVAALQLQAILDRSQLLL